MNPELEEPPKLPHYEQAALDSLKAIALIDLLTHNEDRVPRNVIDTCAARAEEFVPIFDQMLDDPRFWAVEELPQGAWWLKLHAVMILA